MVAIEIAGKTFNRLTAIARVANKPGDGCARWMFQCACGNTHVVASHLVRSGAVKSCGCLKAEQLRNGLRRTHGQTFTSTYAIWSAILGRCQSPSHSGYHKYGARGITVCERWQSFENFLADMGERPQGMSIDRIDNTSGYSPENCRWADSKTQMRNQARTIHVEFEGKTVPLRECAERLGINFQTLWNRYRLGKRGAELFKQPS